MVWKLHRLQPQNPAAHSKCSRKDHFCLIPLPFTTPAQPAKQSALGASTPNPHTASSVFSTFPLGEKTLEAQYILHQTAQQLHPTGCQEAELSPSLPPLLFCPLERLDYTQTHPYFQCQQIYKKKYCCCLQKITLLLFYISNLTVFFLCIIMHIDITTIFRL